MSGRLDLRSQRFGELVARLPVGRTQRGVIWLCECDCGRLALRPAAKLRFAVADGRKPCCERCSKELWRGGLEAAKLQRREVLLDYFQKFGSLWPESTVRRIEDGVRADLAAAFGATLDRYDGAAVADEVASTDVVRRQQRAFYLYPIAIPEDEGVWQCVDCAAWFCRGFGCVACVEPVCRVCVAGERHVCSASERDACETGETLDAVGAEFGVSRARAGQIEAAALRRMSRYRFALGTDKPRPARARPMHISPLMSRGDLEDIPPQKLHVEPSPSRETRMESAREASVRLTAKIWCDDEPEPDGLFNRRTCPHAPENWFREEPRNAAELYALELGVGERRIHVLDDSGQRHVFVTKVHRDGALVANVRCDV